MSPLPAIPTLTGCCVRCGQAPSISIEPGHDVPLIHVAPRCQCYEAFNLWQSAYPGCPSCCSMEPGCGCLIHFGLGFKATRKPTAFDRRCSFFLAAQRKALIDLGLTLEAIDRAMQPAYIFSASLQRDGEGLNEGESTPC